MWAAGRWMQWERRKVWNFCSTNSSDKSLHKSSESVFNMRGWGSVTLRHWALTKNHLEERRWMYLTCITWRIHWSELRCSVPMKDLQTQAMLIVPVQVLRGVQYKFWTFHEYFRMLISASQRKIWILKRAAFMQCDRKRDKKKNCKLRSANWSSQ